VLPVVLGSAGALFKCLDRATNETNIPMLGKRNCIASSTYTACRLSKCCVPTAILGKAKANLRIKGNDMRQIFCLSSYPILP